MQNPPSSSASRPGDLADERIHLPAIVEQNRSSVERGFLRKIGRVFAHIPFSGDLLAAYHCAIDTRTPMRVRGVLLAALAYFVMPADLIPDFIAGLGFTDDATVLATAIGLVSSHIKPAHRDKAEAQIADLKDASPAETPRA